MLAGGCFWCVEAVFAALDGVLEVTSGYTGGSAESADYKSVCGGGTDHAEAVRVRFDRVIDTPQVQRYLHFEKKGRFKNPIRRAAAEFAPLRDN